MTRLANLSVDEVGKALENAGYSLKRTKKNHRVYFRQCPEPPTIVTVPNHRELRPGTVRAIIRQAGPQIEEFLALCHNR